MEVKICYSPSLAILVHLYQQFAPPHSPANQLAAGAGLVSERFCQALTIYESLSRVYQDDWQKIFQKEIEGRLSKKFLKPIKKLSNYLPSLGEFDQLSRKIEEKGRETKSQFFQQFSRLVFPLSNQNRQSFYLILAPSFSFYWSRGSSLGKIILKTIREKESPEEIIDVFYHEIIHSLIKQNQSLLRQWEKIAAKLNLPSKSDEPLVYLLAPKGILSVNLGLINTFKPKKLLASIRVRWIKNAVEKLLLLLKDYDWRTPKMTIVDFLNKKIS